MSKTTRLNKAITAALYTMSAIYTSLFTKDGSNYNISIHTYIHTLHAYTHNRKKTNKLNK